MLQVSFVGFLLNPRCAPSHGGFHPVGFVVGAFGS